MTILFFITVIVVNVCFLNAFRQQSIFLENATVRIEQGLLQGERRNDYWGEKFYSFEGIPYAKPPIGELRFKAPIEPKHWVGLWDATKMREVCTQKRGKLKQSENCLYLNVYSKMNHTLQPVMVWIHGGAFSIGSPYHFYGPEFLMSENIVLVTIQYRLNIFGYLSFDDPKLEIPGNAGFKDQVMALKWVQKNIKQFGGDPNKVTIFGNSAGGASIHLLYLSPLSKGLFHQAIAQSGSATNPWVTGPNRNKELAQILNCSGNSEEEIFQCLYKTSANDIIEAQHKLASSLNLKGADQPFRVLTIEKQSSGSFLSNHPKDIIANGNFNHVPFMTGFNTHEGAYFFDNFEIPHNFTDPQILIPKNLNSIYDNQMAQLIGKAIKELYYGSTTPNFEAKEEYINYVTDVMFLIDLYQNAIKQAAVMPTVPVYFYHFKYHTRLNLARVNLNISNMATHTDEIPYLFYVKSKMSKIKLTREEEIAVHRMIKLWTNFAKTGNPNQIDFPDPLIDVKWKPLGDILNYLEIGPELRMETNPVERRMRFWENLIHQTV